MHIIQIRHIITHAQQYNSNLVTSHGKCTCKIKCIVIYNIIIDVLGILVGIFRPSKNFLCYFVFFQLLVIILFIL